MITKFFSHEFIKSLPGDYVDTMWAIVGEFEMFDRAVSLEPIKYHEDYTDVIALLVAISERYPDRLNIDIPVMGASKMADIKAVREVVAQIRSSTEEQRSIRDAKDRLSRSKEAYNALLNETPVYEFSDHDLGRVQELINELRNSISTSKAMPESHRRRLIRRLEALQRELNKTSSDMVQFWAFLGEARLFVRNLGDDMKPISDRIQEMGRIIALVILAKEGLPALPGMIELLKIGP